MTTIYSLITTKDGYNATAWFATMKEAKENVMRLRGDGFLVYGPTRINDEDLTPEYRKLPLPALSANEPSFPKQEFANYIAQLELRDYSRSNLKGNTEAHAQTMENMVYSALAEAGYDREYIVNLINEEIAYFIEVVAATMATEN